MKLTLSFIVLFYTHFCFAQTDTTNSIFVKDNYKIQYPKSWQLDTSKLMGTDFFVLAPLENEIDKFRENVSGIIQDLSGQNIDLEIYKQITDKQILEFATEPKIFESEIINSNKNNYYKTVYAMTQGKARLKITSVCYIKNEKAYLITFTSEIEKYEQYKKVGEDIISSFHLVE